MSRKIGINEHINKETGRQVLEIIHLVVLVQPVCFDVGLTAFFNIPSISLFNKFAQFEYCSLMHFCSHMFIVLCIFILPRGGDK